MQCQKVVWVHGIDDDNLKRESVEMGIKDDVQCLIGCGQPDRPTAKKKTVDDLTMVKIRIYLT
jgi:hypothetical protein